jgi:glutaconyl-CoA/methylmalonyl-CoA decarboxylase subunit delta
MNLLGEVIFDLSRITSADTTLAVVGYVIVFAALITLYLVFQYVPVVLNSLTKRKIKSSDKKESVISDFTISGEVSAAISTALHLYFNEMHDDEKTVLTISKISKRYSPWSSKIYNVTKGLNRRF